MRGHGSETWRILMLAVLLGAFAGVGGYTFSYAKGTSYLSSDPSACVNCHIMQRQYDGWQKASHHAVAVCVDCHLPQSFVAKWWAKSENGYRHGKKFTTQRFEEPIVVQAAGQAILQDNCVRCHEALVGEMLSAADAPGAAGHGDGIRCVHCHATVGHGEKAGLGGPLTLDDWNPGHDAARPAREHEREER
jgi:cytochrome c nitrite reductase small subunit